MQLSCIKLFIAMSVASYALLSVLFVSVVSLIGILFIANKDRKEGASFTRYMMVLIALAIGALTGDVALHLVPEAAEELGASAYLYVFLGFLLFAVLERVLHWQHSHPTKVEGKIEPRGMLNLIADGVHNFIDGALIAASYLISPVVGFATTLAVVLHEIPQEFGDYAILRDAGFKPKQALLFNLLSGLMAVAGALIVLYSPLAAELPEAQIVAFAAGGFVYISFLLIARLYATVTSRRIVAYSVATLFGLLIMIALSVIEPAHSQGDEDHGTFDTEQHGDDSR